MGSLASLFKFLINSTFSHWILWIVHVVIDDLLIQYHPELLTRIVNNFKWLHHSFLNIDKLYNCLRKLLVDIQSDQLGLEGNLHCINIVNNSGGRMSVSLVLYPSDM